MHVTLGDQELRVTAHVVSELAHPFILGMDALQQLHATVDVKEKKLRIAGGSIPFAAEDWDANNQVKISDATMLPPGISIVNLPLDLCNDEPCILWPMDNCFGHGLFWDPSIVQGNADGCFSLV